MMQAFALTAEQFELATGVAFANLEAVAGIHRGDETDDPLGDPIPLNDGLGQIVLVLAAVGVLT